MKDTYAQIIDKLDQYESYLVTAHPAPDGDALGSCLAFYQLLKDRGKTVTFIVMGYIEHRIRFLLEGVDYAEYPQGLDRPYDCVIAFDVGDHHRIKEILEAVKPHSPFLINIDHHASNRGFANIDLVDVTASSSGEIVYNILNSTNTAISPALATGLYTAVACDTGFFSYSNTTPQTLRVASHLVELGADREKSPDKVLRGKPLKVFQLEAAYTSRLQFSPQGHLVWGTIPREVCEKHQVSLHEVSNFIEIPRNVEGVKVSALFRETEQPGQIKLSFRSNDDQLDVNVFASKFGGGGHPRASGCKIEGELEAIAEKVMAALVEYYQEKKGSAP